MTHYRHRGLKTVVDTTQEAEYDYADYRIDRDTQEFIAGQLKEIPRSVRDRVEGDVRLRVIRNWDVMFAITVDGDHWVITIAGIAPKGEMEPLLHTLWRAVMEMVPPPLRILLEGRRPK